MFGIFTSTCKTLWILLSLAVSKLERHWEEVSRKCRFWRALLEPAHVVPSQLSASHSSLVSAHKRPWEAIQSALQFSHAQGRLGVCFAEILALPVYTGDRGFVLGSHRNVQIPYVDFERGISSLEIIILFFPSSPAHLETSHCLHYSLYFY